MFTCKVTKVSHDTRRKKVLVVERLHHEHHVRTQEKCLPGNVFQLR